MDVKRLTDTQPHPSQIHNRIRLFVFLLYLVVPSIRAQSQELAGPPGSYLSGTFFIDWFGESEIYGSYEDHSVWIVIADPSDPNNAIAATDVLVYRTPPGRSVVSAAQKSGTKQSTLPVVVLLDDGSVVVCSPGQDPKKPWSSQRWLPPGPLGSESFRKIVGDALYSLSSSVIRVSRDSGKTWNVDTTGLHGDVPTDIDLDTLQFVYATTSGSGGNQGLYRQHADSSTWRKISSLPTQPLSAVFVDRRQRIYVGSNSSGVWFSTDAGTFWFHDTAGMGNVQITQFTDDAFGNIYAVNGGGFSGGPVYRSAGGTPPWTRIDGALRSITGQSVIVNGIAGDTLLNVATNFGSFISTDRGTTWIETNKQVKARNYYGFARTTNGRFVVSTDLGIFGKGSKDTSWTKLYPSSGYLSRLTLQSGNPGNIFSSYYPNTNSFSIFTSTDNGISWNQENAGLPARAASPLFVDEAGTKHIRADIDLAAYADAPYAKKQGGAWAIDTAGLTFVDYAGVAAFGSNRAGWLYMSGSYPQKMVKRPLDGGRWITDSVGLGSVQYLVGLMADQNGNMIGHLYSSMFQQQAGVWRALPKPSAVSTNANITAMTVDSSGAIIAAFSRGFPLIGAGVFFTTNNGTNWTKLGLDSVIVNQLVSYGDTTYALTEGRGLFVITKGSATSTVKNAVTASSFSLSQNYPNPFNPTTNIEFRISNPEVVKLSVFDILGREVAVLMNERKDAGAHKVKFDGANLASGVYFYRLRAGDFVQTRRLLLLK